MKTKANQTRMSYSEVFNVLAQYAGDLLPMFADGWERFPDEAGAAALIAKMEEKSKSWRICKNDTASDLLRAAMAEIELRAS